MNKPELKRSSDAMEWAQAYNSLCSYLDEYGEGVIGRVEKVEMVEGKRVGMEGLRGTVELELKGGVDGQEGGVSYYPPEEAACYLRVKDEVREKREGEEFIGGLMNIEMEEGEEQEEVGGEVRWKLGKREVWMEVEVIEKSRYGKKYVKEGHDYSREVWGVEKR